MKVKILPLFFLFISITIFGQKLEYPVSTIPDSLKQNANSVVRLSQTNIDIASQKSMTTKSILVTTVLNELGLRNLQLAEGYNKNTRINKIQATVYDASGRELKTYRKKDFKDHSAADGSTLFSDSRFMYLEYTPIAYPFTIVFETEIETSNTAFIPWWSPNENYLTSTEDSSITITYKTELKLKIKEYNFSDKFPVVKKETGNSISYTAKNLAAKKSEELTPEFTDVFPVIYFALENFQLENVDGTAINWQQFGQWYYDSLLSDTEEIPQETQLKIKQLVGNEKDPVEISRIIYKYVQEKTRYVSIQVGIGGWKPMLAKDVDKLGYGDCKALTNYTRSLLKSLGIVSYFTLVYAGADSKKDITADLAFAQGNHAILTIPTKNGMIWLECTSQVQPFGFQGDFTDDRNVLVIKPEGGEIVKTKIFTEKDNLKTINGSYQINENGDLSGKLKIISKSLRYEEEFGKERISRENQIRNYKEEFDNINNLMVKKINLTNNAIKVEFTEDLELEAEGYAKNSGGKLMFALNAFDQDSDVPKKYKSREFPFEMQRGFTNEDEIEILIPDGFIIEAKPNGLERETEFGYYKIEFSTMGPNKILCKRKLVIRKGLYDKSKYEEYRKFRETIAKNDNSKMIISKT